MASSLLRRKVSTLGVSRLVHGITQPFPLLLESKNEALVSVSNAMRQFSASSRYTNLDFTSSSGSSKFDCLDLTRPHTWYPNARRKKRKIFLHMGSTNSGKTHRALKRLESSASGMYCAPLRLLAWEVAKRLNKAKVPCDLITGQEREEIEGAKHKAVTVEMADVTSNYDCAMLSCRTRGCSFTRALLGISADEIHVCGDAAAVPLIQDILSVTGLQASRFNDESSEFDVLVASDAIGMGLNLNISRIIFSTMKKFDGIEERELTVPEIKQIAGRAGRYGSKFPTGEVTCMDAHYLPLLHSSLKAPSPTLERAGLFPTFDLMNVYSRLHPRSGFYEILEHFVENAKLSASYFIADSEEMMKVAAVIDQLPLSLEDKYLFCNSPVDMDDDISAQGLTQFAENYAKKGIVRLREIFIPGMLEVPKSQNELKELESIHKVLDLYVWLSFRLESSFPDHEVASAQKSICSSLIEEFLERFGLEKPKFNIQKLHSLSERVRRSRHRSSP
ncbi:hypothetical protein TIFTF001_015917 [Ficus carica]|uniref:Helicase C-terminal domain-containing protein n=1 Tax=Ficus carica TaxID=3494 RepID=A0AA88A6S9_FICCA|nr:hypothetical protein TIFTF001_015917 [Ficus carica]